MKIWLGIQINLICFSFPLANFFARSDFFLLSKLNYFQMVVAESSKTKGKSRFARKNSLVQTDLIRKI